MAEAFRHYIQDAANVERARTREEVSERERSLSTVAFAAGVTHYQFSRTRATVFAAAVDIKTVKGKLKQARREFGKLDKPKG
jgi:TRAP-type C4-dicarboxylate transport system substrate-binding protein